MVPPVVKCICPCSICSLGLNQVLPQGFSREGDGAGVWVVCVLGRHVLRNQYIMCSIWVLYDMSVLAEVLKLLAVLKKKRDTMQVSLSWKRGSKSSEQKIIISMVEDLGEGARGLLFCAKLRGTMFSITCCAWFRYGLYMFYKDPSMFKWKKWSTRGCLVGLQILWEAF